MQLEIRGLTKTFASMRALDHLDLSIHEWRDTLPDGTYNIYTEQQVSQLLANHGIQEKQG